MKPFEMRGKGDVLRDANDAVIEIPPVPNEDVLERLAVAAVDEATMEITNVTAEVQEDEGWRFSDVPTEVTRFTVEKIMIDLAGESWYENEHEDGLSAGDMIGLLSKRAFVQFSALSTANIKACLELGGKVLAYFPDLVWREHFGQLPALPGEVLGMRTVEVVAVTEQGGVIVNDLSSPEGRGLLLDAAAFQWLAKDGWMLEVYK